METRNEDTNRADWRLLLFFLPQLIVVGLITFYVGGGIAESWHPGLAYPAAFMIGVIVATVGTAIFGDSPSTLMEIGCGGVILCVIVAILLPVFAQARQKARAQRSRAAMAAEARADGTQPAETRRVAP